MWDGEDRWDAEAEDGTNHASETGKKPFAWGSYLMTIRMDKE